MCATTIFMLVSAQNFSSKLDNNKFSNLPIKIQFAQMVPCRWMLIFVEHQEQKINNFKPTGVTIFKHAK